MLSNSSTYMFLHLYKRSLKLRVCIVVDVTIIFKNVFHRTIYRTLINSKAFKKELKERTVFRRYEQIIYMMRFFQIGFCIQLNESY